MGPPLPRAEGRLKEAAGVPEWKPCFSKDCCPGGREGEREGAQPTETEALPPSESDVVTERTLRPEEDTQASASALPFKGRGIPRT